MHHRFILKSDNLISGAGLELQSAGMWQMMDFSIRAGRVGRHALSLCCLTLKGENHVICVQLQWLLERDSVVCQCYYTGHWPWVRTFAHWQPYNVWSLSGHHFMSYFMCRRKSPEKIDLVWMWQITPTHCGLQGVKLAVLCFRFCLLLWKYNLFEYCRSMVLRID